MDLNILALKWTFLISYILTLAYEEQCRKAWSRIKDKLRNCLQEPHSYEGTGKFELLGESSRNLPFLGGRLP